MGTWWNSWNDTETPNASRDREEREIRERGERGRERGGGERGERAEREWERVRVRECEREREREGERKRERVSGGMNLSVVSDQGSMRIPVAWSRCVRSSRAAAEAPPAGSCAVPPHPPRMRRRLTYTRGGALKNKMGLKYISAVKRENGLIGYMNDYHLNAQPFQWTDEIKHDRYIAPIVA
jgi:hypothetical protein